MVPGSIGIYAPSPGILWQRRELVLAFQSFGLLVIRIAFQVAESPVVGRAAIREMFAAGFAAAPMVCIVESLFEDGEWAILEWRDPLGLRGCGFFHIVDNRIVFQRGYWDKLTFLRMHGLPIPADDPAD